LNGELSVFANISSSEPRLAADPELLVYREGPHRFDPQGVVLRFSLIQGAVAA